jgi:hypothetical protein
LLSLILLVLVGDSLDQAVPQMDGSLVEVVVDLDLNNLQALAHQQLVDMVAVLHPQEDLSGVVLEMVWLLQEQQ